MTVRGVDHHEVDAGLDEKQARLYGVLPDADSGTDDESAARVLGRVREGLALREVLDRDQARGRPTSSTSGSFSTLCRASRASA